MTSIGLGRRSVLGLASLAAWSGLRAQGKPRSGRLGVLWLGEVPTDVAAADGVQLLRSRLRQLGWVEGRNLSIESRFVGDGLNPSREIEQLLAMKVDVIVAMSSTIAVAVRNTTGSVPVVFAMAGDPVLLGLVDSLAQPGRSMTVIYANLPAQAGKRLGLLHEAVRGSARIGALRLHASTVGGEYKLTKSAADKLGVGLVDVAANSIEDFDAVLLAASKSGITAVTLMTETTIRNSYKRLAAMLIKHGLPSIAGHADYVRLGGMMSYGPSGLETLNRTAALAAKILAGARPAAIPVEQNTRFGLYLNLKTAKSVGVVFPKTLLAYADKVIS